MYLDLLPTTSVSRTKSRILTVSTLSSFIKSRTISAEVVAVERPAWVVDVIPVSAKFFSPLVWIRRFTGFINSSYVIGLWTLYDKFW